MSQPLADDDFPAGTSATVTATIKVINYYSSAKRFYIFQDLPQPGNPPSKQPFSNVYLSCPPVQPDPKGLSSGDFQISNTYYAIFGTNKGIGGDVVIATSSAKEVSKLGPGGDVFAMSVVDEAPSWDSLTAQDKKTSQSGGFGFWTDSSFVIPNTNNIYIGVAAQDPAKGTVVPIQTWQAEPTYKHVLYPKITYYVCTGEYKPGTAVDRQSMGQWCKLEFEGAPITDAVIEFTPTGQFKDHNGQTASNGIRLSTGTS